MTWRVSSRSAQSRYALLDSSSQTDQGLIESCLPVGLVHCPLGRRAVTTIVGRSEDLTVAVAAEVDETIHVRVVHHVSQHIWIACSLGPEEDLKPPCPAVFEGVALAVVDIHHPNSRRT